MVKYLIPCTYQICFSWSESAVQLAVITFTHSSRKCSTTTLLIGIESYVESMKHTQKLNIVIKLRSGILFHGIGIGICGYLELSLRLRAVVIGYHL